ncbi:D-alanyl-D-alanine carboxypeptidase/D-alanyl-D-alanine-endopeptidase [Candidatus Sumerlaeota bacterium]|nr:D-alanyl-D-alanine carboxypeptidase/D-alanyl-D-alanine-endopeptidase [Candidatus Sumerlaeota bacterium]MBI3735122.1 D-alanyl-D-alanine carboxypeptidase/D-alanyl-D-alanine-endopeptidase [Candidatus Sumerlaeota bacterium]
MIQKVRPIPRTYFKRHRSAGILICVCLAWALAGIFVPAEAAARTSKKSKAKSSAKTKKSSPPPDAPAEAKSAPRKSSSAISDPQTIEDWYESLRQAEARYNEDWSCFVRDLQTGETILDYKGSQRLIPASNRKIITFALALSYLGPEFRFKTEFGLTKSLGNDRGRITASAVLRSNGDPTLSPRYLNQKNPATQICEWIKGLKKAGISRLQGDFVIDASAFGSEQDVHPEAWGEDHIGQSYAPLPSAIALNDNILRVTVEAGSSAGSAGVVHLYPSAKGISLENQTRTDSGGQSGFGAKFTPGSLELILSGRVYRGRGEVGAQVPLTRPLAFLRAIIEDELKNSNIEVAGKIRLISDPREARQYVIEQTLGSHESPPLSDLLEIMMRESDNFLAEQTWRAAAYRANGEGSVASARKLERAWYADHKIEGIEPGWDGSGLSRKDAISARELTLALQAIYGSPYRSYLLSDLPSSGRSGTLRGRDMGGAPGRVVAKTGTLSGVGSLSGFLRDTKGRERYVFSLIGNSPTYTKGRLTTRENQIMNILMKLLDSSQKSETAARGGEKREASEEPSLRAATRKKGRS